MCSLRSYGWTETEATVAKVSLVERKRHVLFSRDPVVEYHPVVTYTYTTAEGSSSVSQILSFRYWGCPPTEKEAEEIVSSVRIGDRFRVWYDPQKISRSVAQPGIGCSGVSGVFYIASLLTLAMKVGPVSGIVRFFDVH